MSAIDAICAVEKCTKCEEPLEGEGSVEQCDDEGEDCGFCINCCQGHCVTCGGADSTERNSDGGIFICFLCKNVTHCDFGYCEEGGFRCYKCKRIVCGKCKGGADKHCKKCVAVKKQRGVKE